MVSSQFVNIIWETENGRNGERENRRNGGGVESPSPFLRFTASAIGSISKRHPVAVFFAQYG